ncbi:beta-lactamase/transpeptidase-like protein [Wilcoxina mikolae CBS 423.85]|nr:beta-lactamase/transpeptidase-like protein [Wilcoxina mikolae CBS 423.85]
MRHLLSLLPFLSIASALTCPMSGPVLPPAKHLPRSPYLHSALQNLTSTLDSAMAGDINPGFLTNQTSFSILLTDSKHKLWEYHHTAPTTTNGTKSVDSNSQYRIASITKMITDLLLLRLELDLEDKITKYLPGLKHGKGGVHWDKITLKDLGSHMAGIVKGYGYPENYTARAEWIALGFPDAPVEDYPLCEVAGAGIRERRCTEELIVKGLADYVPVVAVHSKPIYSNIAFSLLGYVIRQTTGMTYEKAVAKYITEPLGMDSTSFLPLSVDTMVIPPIDAEPFWNLDFMDSNPAGGAYSTVHDLSLLQQKLLSGGSHFLSDAKLRAWLKPLVFGTEINAAVGFPWEITRTNTLTTRDTVDIYSKDGGITGYTSRFSLIPDYGFGFIILVAGNTETDPTVTILAEAVLAAAFPAIESAMRSEVVLDGYTGKFSSGNGSSYITVIQDDGPGLVVSEWHSRGINSKFAVDKGLLTWRVYPAEIVNGEDEDWRVVFDLPDLVYPQGLGNKGVWKDACYTWFSVDALHYAGQPVDRVVVKKRGGKVWALYLPALRITLIKE